MMKKPNRHEKSRQFLERACEEFELGNIEKAVVLLKKSAALGSNEAKVNLGNLYSEGRGVDLAPALAKSLYRSAFKNGCAYGATALGVQYRNEGKLRLAILWWNKAATMGEDWAKEYLDELPSLPPASE